MRVVVVDLLCNSPPYSAAIVRALCGEGAKAELASPDFYLEPGFLSGCPRSPWLVDMAIDAGSPRIMRQALRVVELWRNFRKLQRAIRRGEYDVVHVQWIPLQQRGTVFMSRLRSACDQARAPLIFTAHNVVPHDDPSADRTMIRKNIDFADQVIAHTKHVADGLREDIGIRPDIAVIPHGPLYIDMELPSRREAAERLGVEDRPVVLLMGRITPYKGPDLIAEAWPAIRQAYPTAVLAIVGRSESDAVRFQLAPLAGTQGVRIVDRFVSTATMLDYYAISDVVVFPYKAISQSGGFMTAVGLGKPTVVTPLEGLLEQVAGLESVIVAKAVSGPALAEALSRALSDRDTLAAAAVRDRSRIMESPGGWPAVARSTLEVYLGARAQQ